MSSGGRVGRVEGGCKDGRGRVDGQGDRRDGEGKGNEIRGVYDDLFQEKKNILNRPMINVDKVREDGEDRDNDQVDVHVDEDGGREERRVGRWDMGGRAYIRDLGYRGGFAQHPSVCERSSQRNTRVRSSTDCTREI